jgi:subtilisin family serine protease
MAGCRTGEVMEMLDQLVWAELYRVSDPTTKGERDRDTITVAEARRLSPTLQSVAQALLAQDHFLRASDQAIVDAAKQRACAALGYVRKNPDQALDGAATSLEQEVVAADVDRIAEPDLRAMVRQACALVRELDDWYLRDPEQDGVEGASVERAYAALQGRPLSKVVVAVLDGGVDISHEDLAGHIWTNADELPGTGRDDDGNGYVDDVHGWNFLGSVDAAGQPVNVVKAPLEVARELYRLQHNDTGRALAPKDRQYLRDLEREVALRQGKVDKSVVNYLWDGGYDERKRVIGDDPDDLADHGYGNNDVVGPDPDHGTHVAGIIAAERANGLGIKGIAQTAEIMPVRVLLDGDEYDKDIAHAIRYAVDNGAQIINMSFGKSRSAHPEAVTEALRYAAAHDVLVVCSAGNSGQDTGVEHQFPELPQHDPHCTWLQVGASAAVAGPAMVGGFSNYGERVDLFAPGVKIRSTVPRNRYANKNGTSMAAPVVAGVAALLKAAYPNVSAAHLREVLLETARHYPDLKVWRPGKGKEKRAAHEPVPFTALSKSGGVVDAYAAVQKLETEQRPTV